MLGAVLRVSHQHHRCVLSTFLVMPDQAAGGRRGEPPQLPLSSWVSLSGYRERWRRLLGGVKSMYTLAKCRKHITGARLHPLDIFSLPIRQPCEGLRPSITGSDAFQCMHPPHHPSDTNMLLPCRVQPAGLQG